MSNNPFGDGDARRAVAAMLASSSEYDHLYFDHLFSRTNWNLFHAHNTSEAIETLASDVIPVVVADERVEPGGWRALLDVMQNSKYSPKLIVSSMLTVDGLWGDVLNMGGYDVLARPFDADEVLHSIGSAWLSWKHDLEHARPVPRPGPAAETTPGRLSGNLIWRAVSG
ncbi:MAG: hypothetical protein KIT09_17900 [Bryobacteraceae bacterium]|nr:hypothetical protein [Bryobacteraceae bacterium]